ncbi:MAG: hypothetical protein QM758_20665 [Armatimonas sp.]
MPDLLRNLLSPSSEVREDAFHALYGNIFHQGTRYQATVPAIPFLIRLVASPNTPARAEVLTLLMHLALGYSEEALPYGVSLTATRQGIEDAIATMSKKERKECTEFGFGPQVVLDCYEAVGTGVPVFLNLLSEDDTDLRGTALYALAWFPEQSSAIFPAIQKALAEATEEEILINGLLAIGLLNQHVENPIPAEVLRPYLLHAALSVRVSAAIALAPTGLTQELVQILAGALTESEALEDATELTLFNEGDLAGYASMILAHYGREFRAVVLPVLSQVLPKVAPYNSLGITRSILNLAIYDPALLIDGEPTHFIQDTPATKLHPQTREALQAIADHGGWQIDGNPFMNYAELMRGYRAPDTQEKLQKYLSL